MRLRIIIPILAGMIGVLAVIGSYYGAPQETPTSPSSEKQEAGAKSNSKTQPEKKTQPEDQRGDLGQAKLAKSPTGSSDESGDSAAAGKPNEPGESAGEDESKSSGEAAKTNTHGEADQPNQRPRANQTTRANQSGEANQAGENSGETSHAQASGGDGEAANGQASANHGETAQASADEQSTGESPAGESANHGSSETETDTDTGRSLKDLHLEPGHYGKWLSFGSDKKNQPYRMRVVFSGFGAGIQRLTLAKERLTAKGDKPYPLIDLPLDAVTRYAPYAAQSVTINGQTVDLAGAKWKAGNLETDDAGQSITFRGIIANDQDQPIVEIVRTYHLAKASYDLNLDQKLINHAGRPLKVLWKQNAQGDLIQSNARYVGDRRVFVTGYFKPDYDNKLRIYANDGYRRRRNLVKTPKLWPNPNLAKDNDYQLAWLAAANRYFTMVTHAGLAQRGDKPLKTANIPPLGKRFGQVHVTVTDKSKNLQRPGHRYVVLRLQTDETTLGPGKTLNESLGIYAGPRDSNVFAKQPFAALYLDRLVRYQLGCTWFTFQPLAHGMLWFLKLIEGQILAIGGIGIGVHDWGVAIVILVICVRLLLHPITKRAQVNMMKMGKQMQALKPEMDKIKQKYKDDQQKLNAEMMKLYREKGMNPASMLGCAPMMLQTPIWIALYAMLFYAIELRHEPAFYGVFQWISAGHWDFLADLSRSDHFITFFDQPHPIHLLFISFDYSAFNILPILMGVVFFINQKFTQPPAANEQAAQQQKIMKFMVLLFPVFLYSAPAGLTLYICTSTMAGIVDSYLVRKHVEEQEEAGTLFKKKERKSGGFMDRLHQAMENKQQQLAQKQQQGQNSQPGNVANRQQRRRKSR